MAKAAAPVLRKLATTEKEPPRAGGNAVVRAGFDLKDKKDEKLASSTSWPTSPYADGAGRSSGAPSATSTRTSRAGQAPRPYEVDAPASLSAAMLSVYAQQGGSAQWNVHPRRHFDAANGRSKYTPTFGPMTQILGRLDDPKGFFGRHGRACNSWR